MKKVAFILAALAVVCMVVGVVDAKPKKDKDPNAPKKEKPKREKVPVLRCKLVKLDTDADGKIVGIEVEPIVRKKKGEDPPAKGENVKLEITEKTKINIDGEKADPPGLEKAIGKPIIVGHKDGKALKIAARTKPREKKPKGDKKPGEGGKKRKPRKPKEE